MHRKTAAAALILAALGLSACDSTTTAADSEEATYTFSPDPAVAVPSTDGLTYTIPADDNNPAKVIAYPWKTSFTVKMAETAGVGRDINSVTLKVQQASGGVVLTPSGSDVEYFHYTSPQSGGSRLAANGETSMTFEVWYDLPNKGRTALVTLGFTFTDDDDNTFMEIAKVAVE